MNQQEATRLISNLLETAKNSVEAALTLGRENNVPVDLNIVGLGGADDMWYVSEHDYRQELEQEYAWENGGPDQPLTEEQEQQVEERLQAIRDGGGYDNGYKVLGWMSSSTNC
jgi:hypothetical protein